MAPESSGGSLYKKLKNSRSCCVFTRFLDVPCSWWFMDVLLLFIAKLPGQLCCNTRGKTSEGTGANRAIQPLKVSNKTRGICCQMLLKKTVKICIIDVQCMTYVLKTLIFSCLVFTIQTIYIKLSTYIFFIIIIHLTETQPIGCQRCQDWWPKLWRVWDPSFILGS